MMDSMRVVLMAVQMDTLWVALKAQSMVDLRAHLRVVQKVALMVDYSMADSKVGYSADSKADQTADRKGEQTAQRKAHKTVH